MGASLKRWNNCVHTGIYNLTILMRLITKKKRKKQQQYQTCKYKDILLLYLRFKVKHLKFCYKNKTF